MIYFEDDEAHEHIIENLNGSKNELFVKANEWLITTFVSSKSVVHFADKEEGVIIGKYIVTNHYNPDMWQPSEERETKVTAVITINVKDHKAMMRIKPEPWPQGSIALYPYTKEDAIKDMKLLTQDFEKFMKLKRKEF